MSLKSRVVFETFDEATGDIKARNEMMVLDITKPETIDEIGLNYESQIQLIG